MNQINDLYDKNIDLDKLKGKNLKSNDLLKITVEWLKKKLIFNNYITNMKCRRNFYNNCFFYFIFMFI